MFTTPLSVWTMDQKVVDSLAQNPTLGKGFTEKQRALVLRLCKKYRTQLVAALGPDADIALDSPEFKFNLVEPTPVEKSITIVGKEILVKFPFNESLVSKIRQNKVSRGMNLAEWDGEAKAWKFSLEENNVLWLMNNVVSPDFSVDDEFLRLSAEITKILEKIEDHVPLVVHEGDHFYFKNVHPSVPQPSGNDLTETLLLAKQYGISTWDETVEKLKENANFSPILTSFLQETTPNSIEFDTNENSVDQLKELFKYNLPAMIIIPGHDEFFTLKFWTLWLKNQGFEEKDISVLFRLSNDTGSMLNDFVKKYNLNNPVEENTKIVFVSQKIPKPLIKSGIDFKLILNLGSLSGVHYSISTYLENRPDVIRYTDKKKLGYQFGLL